MALRRVGIPDQGHSSSLTYDKCAYDAFLEQSVGPILYRMNPTSINNCQSCLSVFGPRGGKYGDSSTVDPHATAPSQQLVDVESVLLNRNVIASKCKDGKVNNIDVTKFQLQHARVCNDTLDPLATHLTNPPANYRELAINRFYDLNTQPQANIFYNFAVNTQLEAKDNYREMVPHMLSPYPELPHEYTGPNCSEARQLAQNAARRRSYD